MKYDWALELDTKQVLDKLRLSRIIWKAEGGGTWCDTKARKSLFFEKGGFSTSEQKLLADTLRLLEAFQTVFPAGTSMTACTGGQALLHVQVGDRKMFAASVFRCMLTSAFPYSMRTIT